MALAFFEIVRSTGNRSNKKIKQCLTQKAIKAEGGLAYSSFILNKKIWSFYISKWPRNRNGSNYLPQFKLSSYNAKMNATERERLTLLWWWLWWWLEWEEREGRGTKRGRKVPRDIRERKIMKKKVLVLRFLAIIDHQKLVPYDTVELHVAQQLFFRKQKVFYNFYFKCCNFLIYIFFFMFYMWIKFRMYKYQSQSDCLNFFLIHINMCFYEWIIGQV